jgi:hypothetical protein
MYRIATHPDVRDASHCADVTSLYLLNWHAAEVVVYKQLIHLANTDLARGQAAAQRHLQQQQQQQERMYCG